MKREENLKFKKLLTSNEEMSRIKRGRSLWKLLRRKRRVLVMLSRLGEAALVEMDRLKDRNQSEKSDEKVEVHKVSKFIIMPDNFWRMQWNNQIIIVFIIWIFLMPIKVCQNYEMNAGNSLLIFDLIFVLDRIMELFVSYYNPNG
jgi:hypothetical protein